MRRAQGRVAPHRRESLCDLELTFLFQLLLPQVGCVRDGLREQLVEVEEVLAQEVY